MVFFFIFIGDRYTVYSRKKFVILGPHPMAPNPRFEPGFIPPHFLYKREGKPRVETGV
jgi:hypothetical protein